MPMPILRLKKNEDRRLRSGHLWIFSNEIETSVTSLDSFEPGELALVQDSKGKSLGTAYVNPKTLICARILNMEPECKIDCNYFENRLAFALCMRNKIFNKPYYRLIHGEGDWLPGLVIDRYSDHCVIQTNTAGMERHKDIILDAVRKVISPRVIIFKNDSSSRELEGLESYVESAWGSPDERLPIEENDVPFEVHLLSGQKTGWFFDHRLNRLRMRAYAASNRVLDVFSYIGGWGIQAAVAGATNIVCVDASKTALEQVSSNAALNGVNTRVETISGDAFKILTELRHSEKKFDVVILDPPALIKRRKDITEGISAYLRLNKLAMQLVNKAGILISASCSFHLSADGLKQIVARSAKALRRSAQIIEQGHQGPDHPVNPAMPETDYLKAFFVRLD